MNTLSKILKYINDPVFRFSINTKWGFYDNLSDEEFLKKKFKVDIGHDLDLSSPVSFNEKIQWLKLYDRKPIYTKMVDKYEVKKYVADQIGEEYIIPTLGVWDKFEDIDFDLLPDQFVLKCTHDSGGLVICKNKKDLNYKKARKKLSNSLKNDYYRVNREWPYKDVKHRIIAEPYLEDEETKELRDYKFFCFNGEVKALFVATDRSSREETKFDFFDSNYNHLPFTNGHPNASSIPQKPFCFEKMKRIASKLSSGISEVRIDLYECNKKVYFGEITFSHWSGFVPFEPKEWDYTFGSWIDLPKK